MKTNPSPALSTALLLTLSVLALSPAASDTREALGQRADSHVTADTLTDAETVRMHEAQMEKGVLEQDLATLQRLWAEEFMVNAPRNVVVPNRAAVLDVFRKGIPDYSTYDTHIESLNISGSLAVVMGTETVKPVGDAPHTGKTVHRRYTHVWREGDDQWTLVARHAHITDIE